LGHRVTGIDVEEIAGVHDNVEAFIQADLDHGIPVAVGGDFDTILAADVLEHVREPGALLDEMRDLLAPGGSIIVSVPNFAHWYPRVRVATGTFDYDRRGILDRTHLRFFTRNSFERLIESRGLRVKRRQYVGLPLEVLDRGGRTNHTGGKAGSIAKTVDKLALELRPTLFAYQFVYELEPVVVARPEILIDRQQRTRRPA
ncbi:MAG: class I SAM-dependent methyltransferase, partial [Actinomycetota bacterium]